MLSYCIGPCAVLTAFLSMARMSQRRNRARKRPGCTGQSWHARECLDHTHTFYSDEAVSGCRFPLVGNTQPDTFTSTWRPGPSSYPRHSDCTAPTDQSGSCNLGGRSCVRQTRCPQGTPYENDGLPWGARLSTISVPERIVQVTSVKQFHRPLQRLVADGAAAAPVSSRTLLLHASAAMSRMTLPRWNGGVVGTIMCDAA